MEVQANKRVPYEKTVWEAAEKNWRLEAQRHRMVECFCHSPSED